MLPDFLFSIQLLDPFIRNMLKILSLKSKSAKNIEESFLSVWLYLIKNRVLSVTHCLNNFASAYCVYFLSRKHKQRPIRQYGI